MIMFSDARRTGEPDEMFFVAPHHIVSVRYNPADAGGGSLVQLSTGVIIPVLEDRNDIVETIEGEVN